MFIRVWVYLLGRAGAKTTPKLNLCHFDVLKEIAYRGL